MYKIIALIGEAGTGKDTLMKEIIKKTPSLHEIISCTTRPMREGEVDGVNYHFLTLEQFTGQVLRNEMLESTNFNNWFYGTSLQSLDKDKINIGVFNPAGIKSMLNHPEVDLQVYRVFCADKIRLIRQLNREKNPDVDEIIRRYGTDKADFANLDFEYEEIYNEYPSDLELYSYSLPAAAGSGWREDKNN